MRGLMSESWLLTSAILGGIGFAAGSVAVIALGALIFCTGGAARFWSRVSLERVTYNRTLSEHHLFAGESVDITMIIENQKLLPVPWVEVRETLPRGMGRQSIRTQPGSSPGTEVLVRATALGANDRLEWPITLRAMRRGYFRVGPTRLRSGDLFGFFEREEEPPGRPDGIVVYPLTYALPDLGLDSIRPFGDTRGGIRIYEDPVRVIGVRDYQPGDPIKRIDWNATARLGRLESKLYEPSRSQAIVIALNIPTFEQAWQGSDPVLLERGISVAASVARWAGEGGASLGLVANGSFPDADRTIRIGAGRRPDQLNRVLEALAMITAFSTSSMATDLLDPRHPLPAGSTVVMIAAVMPDELAGTLHRLRGDGHIVHVLKTSNTPWAANLDRIPVTELAPVIEELEAVAIAEGIIEAPEGAAP
jgi:uncharacterized protein (DUF58 family)